MPIVIIEQSPRDIERKRRLVAGITEAFVDAYEVSNLAEESVRSGTGNQTERGLVNR